MPMTPEGPVTTGISYTANWYPVQIPNQNLGIHVEYGNTPMNLITRCINIIRNLPESRNPPRIQVDSESRTSNLGVTDPSMTPEYLSLVKRRCGLRTRPIDGLRTRPIDMPLFNFYGSIAIIRTKIVV